MKFARLLLVLSLIPLVPGGARATEPAPAASGGGPSVKPCAVSSTVAAIVRATMAANRDDDIPDLDEDQQADLCCILRDLYRMSMERWEGLGLKERKEFLKANPKMSRKILDMKWDVLPYQAKLAFIKTQPDIQARAAERWKTINPGMRYVFARRHPELMGRFRTPPGRPCSRRAL